MFCETQRLRTAKQTEYRSFKLKGTGLDLASKSVQFSDKAEKPTCQMSELSDLSLNISTNPDRSESCNRVQLCETTIVPVYSEIYVKTSSDQALFEARTLIDTSQITNAELERQIVRPQTGAKGHFYASKWNQNSAESGVAPAPHSTPIPTKGNDYFRSKK